MSKRASPIPKKDLSFEEEIALVERAKHDRDAFGELYDLYFDRVYQYMYYRVGNHEDAEDLTARVFYRMLKALPRYKVTNAPFGAWVFRIAHNLVANWHRDQKRRRFLSLDDLPLWRSRRSTTARCGLCANRCNNGENGSAHGTTIEHCYRYNLRFA